MTDYDLVIRSGTVFDGTGAEPVRADVGVRAGRVTAVSAEPLPAGRARVLDAADKWVMPGLLDVHTHYDAEVLVSPGLGESVRHGVTTVVMGNCSLSTVYAEPADCADLFARVEALPWDAVHGAVKENRTWHDPRSYIDAIAARPLGANVTALIGHSDLRVASMGLARSVDAGVHPTADELARMTTLLRESLDAGFIGLSTIRSTFSKLAGERYATRQLPATYADWRECRALNDVLRSAGRLLQCTPNLTRRAEVVRFLTQSAGRLHGAPLKTSLLTAADLKADAKVVWAAIAGAWLANTVLGADFRWQHLPVPFELYADGIDLVVFEEFGSGTAALNIRDEIGRTALLADEDYRRWFRRDCAKRFGQRVWHRDLHDARIVECPDGSVIGLSFGDIAHRRGLEPADAFLDLVVEHGSKLRWRTTIANHRPAVLDRIARSSAIQMGFADSGAHLRNMAFYNGGLRLLGRVQQANANPNANPNASSNAQAQAQERARARARGGSGRASAPGLSVARAVHRLTGELGQWYGIDAGTLCVGSRADIAVIDPAGLAAAVAADAEADADAAYAEAPMPEFGGLARMVNRNDRAVAATVVGGHVVFEYGTFAAGFGTTLHAGTFLRAR